MTLWSSSRSIGGLFCEDVVDVFFRLFTYEELRKVQGDAIGAALREELAPVVRDYSDEDIRGIASIFARITDYKSSFTRKHSMGIAHKASRMARFYNMGETMETKLYLTGALHDLGKLVIDNDILEKPGKLTDEEFTEMKNHAWFTWTILHDIDGFEEIVRWAAFHHEKALAIMHMMVDSGKLDGSIVEDVDAAYARGLFEEE